MTTSSRITGAAADDPPGTNADANGSGCASDHSPFERIWQTLQGLEELIRTEQWLDAPAGVEVRDRLQLIGGDLRAAEQQQMVPVPPAVTQPFLPQGTGLRELDLRSTAHMERRAALYESAEEGMVILDAAGRIEDFNPAFLTLAARSRDQVSGRPLATILEWAFAEYDEVLQGAIDGQTWSGRVVVARGDRNERTFLMSFNPLRPPHAAGSVGVLISDVTEFERTHRRLKRLALHDQLTGLPNRRFYCERVRSLIDSCRRDKSTFAVCFIDLDDFKSVNDTLGHKKGDELLVQIARRLKQHVQDDAFVARLSGDEFAMLIPNTDRDLRKTATVADKVLRALRDPIGVGETMARIGASLGVTEYPAHSTDIEQLLQNADVAMYAAKKAGRNQICVFAPEMNRHVEQRQQLLRDLQRALRGSEISLRYQPLIDLRTGALSGCEALARWRTPDGRDIMPGEFVPVAESSGLVIPLGELVLVEACRQLCEWEALGVRPPLLGVNISPQHLHSRSFFARTAEILETTGAKPEWLMFEITENAIEQDPHNAMQTMDALVDLGMALAIDDFGTGRSSFSELRRFNIHALKIDGSFISELHSDSQARSFVESMIHLGQGRQLQIVAEGIENAEQYQLLCEMGCDIGQGYHIARPLRATALECWWDEAPV